VSEPLLLDTCACLWLTHGDPMSGPSRRAIADAQRGAAGIHVSLITAWEVATLVAKGRYRLMVTPKVWFARLLALPGIRSLPLTVEILIDSTTLPGRPPKDPADRIIAASARQYGYTIVTRDSELLPYGRQGFLRTLVC
jgi:PIN domain nuclease of toxin-antitoxin system